MKNSSEVKVYDRGSTCLERYVIFGGYELPLFVSATPTDPLKGATSFREADADDMPESWRKIEISSLGKDLKQHIQARLNSVANSREEFAVFRNHDYFAEYTVIDEDGTTLKVSDHPSDPVFGCSEFLRRKTEEHPEWNGWDSELGLKIAFADLPEHIKEHVRGKFAAKNERSKRQTGS